MHPSHFSQGDSYIITVQEWNEEVLIVQRVSLQAVLSQITNLRDDDHSQDTTISRYQKGLACVTLCSHPTLPPASLTPGNR